MGLLEQLTTLADLARETSGASFTITRNKSAIWQVTFVNKGTSFRSLDLETCVERAIEHLNKRRKLIEPTQKYKL